MTPTRYGKSATVAAGVIVRASTKNEKWAIVAGSRDKAQIIMDYAIGYSLDDPLIKTQLAIDGSLERLRRERSRDRLTFCGVERLECFLLIVGIDKRWVTH